MRKRNILSDILEVMYPVLVYYVLMLLIMYGARGIFGSDSSHYMLCQSVVAVILLPIMYTGFYKPDLAVWGKTYSRKDRSFRLLVLLLLAALLIGTGLNNLIVMSPLTDLSAGYTEASENFYGSSAAMELLASGLLTPILEELVYRGIIYGRARRIFGRKRGMFLSALIFAVLHFNLVQLIYAFLLGLVFVILLEETGELAVPAAAHILLNILAIGRTEYGWLAGTISKSPSAWFVSIAFLAAGLFLLIPEIRRNPVMHGPDE